MSGSKLGRSRVLHEPRSLTMLQELGALSQRQSKLVTRAAGLMRQKDMEPESICVTPDVLEQLNTPAIEASLFPAEKRMRAGLWKQLVWEDVPEAAPPIKLPDLEVRDLSKVSLQAEDKGPIPIAGLAPAVQKLAHRVALASGREESGEISLADIEMALEHEAFIREEKESNCSVECTWPAGRLMLDTRVHGFTNKAEETDVAS